MSRGAQRLQQRGLPDDQLAHGPLSICLDDVAEPGRLAHTQGSRRAASGAAEIIVRIVALIIHPSQNSVLIPSTW